MVDIAHRVGIKAPASQVYQALATPEGVAAWWAEDTHGDREAGGTVKVRFTNNGQEIGAMEMLLVQLIPGELVLWKFLAGPAEWIGTHARFALKQKATTASCCSPTKAGRNAWSSPPTAAPSGRCS